MSEHDVYDKNSVYNRFMMDDDPFAVWDSELKGILWPGPDKDVFNYGLTELDRILGGLRKGSLVVVEGKMGSGKSDLAETLIYNLCWRQKTTGMFFVPGRRDGFTLAGLAAIHAKLPFVEVIAHGDGTEAIAERLASAIQELSAMRLVLDDRGGLSLRDIRERIRIAKLQYEIEFAVIDKWQNYSNPFRFDDTGLCFLKKLARRFDIPIVLFARMNTEGDKRLTITDVDELGFLDHPDAVILMHNDDRNEAGKVELEVVKSRYGSLSSVRVAHIDYQHRFENLTMAGDFASV